MTIFPLSQHIGLNIDKLVMLQQKIACCDKKREEANNLAETKKVYVATRFFSRMSTPGRIYRYKEVPVVTNETGRKQKFCRNKGSSIMTLIIAWKSLLR